MIGHWIVSYESSDSQLEGPEEVEPIEPLVESEPLGLIWSVNEIVDFRNHGKIHKNFYMNSIFRIGNFISNEIVHINIFQIIDRCIGERPNTINRGGLFFGRLLCK